MIAAKTLLAPMGKRGLAVLHGDVSHWTPTGTGTAADTSLCDDESTVASGM